MRIGLIAPPWVPVPPPAYGGTEVVIDNLARGLQELGNEVRLFTVGESQCPVPTDYLYPKAIAPIGVTARRQRTPWLPTSRWPTWTSSTTTRSSGR